MKKKKKKNLHSTILSLCSLLTGLLTPHAYVLFSCIWVNVKNSWGVLSFWMILCSLYQDRVRSARFPVSQVRVAFISASQSNVTVGLGAYWLFSTTGTTIEIYSLICILLEGYRYLSSYHKLEFPLLQYQSLYHHY